MHHIHISDIRTFRDCRRRWNWSSHMRNNLEPAVPYIPFFIGRAIHFCLERMYGDKVDVWTSLDVYLENEQKIAGTLWKHEQEKWDESVDLITEILGHYVLWIQVDTSDYRDSNLEFMDMEVPFNVPVYHPETGVEDPNIRLEGRFDGIVLHKPTNKFWVWETKTARSISELVNSLENDEQAGAYIYAGQMLKDIKIEGVLYNILRKKAPTHPRILQDGFLSKQKGEYTAFSYIADIRRYHTDWDWPMIEQYYGSVFLNLSVGDNAFFRRHPVRRSQFEINQLMGNIYWTAQEMIDPNTKLYPAPSFIKCSLCQFRAPCLTMSRGGNYQSLLRAEYQQRIKAESYREVETP